MKIDIHRHAKDRGTARQVIRNLFHDQSGEIENNNYYSIGLHPWHVNLETLDSAIDTVRETSHDTHILAIGEAGLDKSIKVPLEIQLKAFTAQIEIAEACNKPMIIHCVRAYNEIFSLRLNSRGGKPWVIHWFNASLQMGLQLIEKNFYLSFGHMLFNRDSKACKAFSGLPVDRIFLETDDAGYTIDDVYQQAALLKGVTVNRLEQQIRSNFIQCFGVKP